MSQSTPVNADTARDADRLKAELRAVTRNTYCVNEKVPPSYDRKWKLYVLWKDGTNSTFWGDDSGAGYERVYRDALRLAPEHGDGSDGG